ATGAGPNLYRCAVARTDSGHAVPLRPDGAIRVERPGPPGLHGLAVPDAELDTRAALPRDVDALAATVVDDDARGERSRCWSTPARGPLRCIRRRRPAPRRGRFRLPGRPGGSRVLGGFFRRRWSGRRSVPGFRSSRPRGGSGLRRRRPRLLVPFCRTRGETRPVAG